MLDVGFVGWRGMVGSVLLERMREKGDFAGIAPAFYSTSAPGAPGPAGLGFDTSRLGDAHDVRALARHDAIVTCQGGDYTKEVHRSSAPRAGTGTGSMPPRPSAWSPGRCSSSTR